MKKLKFIFLIALSTVLTMNIKAGDDDKIGGIRAGYQSAAVHLDGNMTEKHLESFYIGLTREKQIVPILHYGVGIEYFQNGLQIDDDNKYVLHYVSIPINLKAKLGPVFARTGVAGNLKVNEKIFIAGNKETPDDKAKIFDGAFYVGAGVEVLMITLEARYHWGLTEFDSGLKNQYFQLGAGIAF